VTVATFQHPRGRWGIFLPRRAIVEQRNSEEGTPVTRPPYRDAAPRIHDHFTRRPRSQGGKTRCEGRTERHHVGDREMIAAKGGLMIRRLTHRYAFPSIPLLAECPARDKNPPPQPSPTRAGGSLNRARGLEIPAFPRNKNRGQRADQKTARDRLFNPHARGALWRRSERRHFGWTRRPTGLG